MSRLSTVILALLLLLGFGSGGLRAVHELSHELPQGSASGASGDHARHACGSGSCRAHRAGEAGHDGADEDSTSASQGDGSTSPGSEPHAPSHHDCLTCEFLATSAPLGPPSAVVLVPSDRCVGAAQIGDEQAPKRVLAGAGDVRGPPRG